MKSSSAARVRLEEAEKKDTARCHEIAYKEGKHELCVNLYFFQTRSALRLRQMRVKNQSVFMSRSVINKHKDERGLLRRNEGSWWRKWTNFFLLASLHVVKMYTKEIASLISKKIFHVEVGGVIEITTSSFRIHLRSTQKKEGSFSCLLRDGCNGKSSEITESRTLNF